MARSFTSLVGADSPFDPSFKLVTSPFFSPVVLAVLRLLFGLYLLVALTSSLVRRAVITHDAKAFLTYFTNLTGIGLCAYLFHAGLMTALYARRVGQRGAAKASYPLQSWPRTLQVLHMILLASVRTLPLIVTIVFWIFLAGDGPLKTPWGRYSNLSVHVFNSVFALFEIICTHTPLSRWFNIVFMILILGGYVGVAYITHATQGFYTYSFLDPSKGAKLAIYIVGIPVAEAIVFALVNGIVALRARFAPKPMPPAERSVPLDDGESMAELEKSDKGSLQKRQQLSSAAAASA